MNPMILKEALALAPEITDHRRYLHAHAKTGFDLMETKAYVREQLEEMGYTVSDCGKCGLTALVEGSNAGKVFLIRADMDGLPIHEDTGLPYSCGTGNMHACGHDMHTAMALGTAKLLMTHKDELNGAVKFMFQPAEELLAGAEDMIEHGILNDPNVDAGTMIHVASAVPFPAGTILIPSGGVSAPAADYFTIKIQGKGCHGSTPQEGVDPLTAAAHILIALQEIQAREMGIADQGVMTIGSLHSGTAANIIPDTAELKGSIRTFEENLRQRIKDRLCEITRGLAIAFRCTAEVTFDSGAPALVNDDALARFAEETLCPFLGDRAFPLSRLKATGPSAGGSEDFAYVSQKVPTIMLSLAAGRPEDGHTYPLHHPKVTFDEEALPYGTAALTALAMEYLSK